MNIQKKTPLSRKASNHLHIVIMAGGSGTRLWPLSRKREPKQFHRFVPDKKTLLEETWNRAKKVLPDAKNIHFSTTTAYKDRIKELIPEVDIQNIIVEPSSRGTAAAIALTTAHIHTSDPEAIIATIASDHFITNDDAFVSALLSAFQTVVKFPEKILTVGINPTEPDTGLGYIKMGEEIDNILNHRVFSIEEFKEKPDVKTAEHYLTNWEYLWNAGYFIFDSKTLLTWINAYAPTLANTINTLSNSDKKNDTKYQNSAKELYEALPNDPIEPLLIEKLPIENRAVIPAPIEWSDIGNWSALFDVLKKQSDVSIIARGNHVDVESEHCLVLGNKKLIATVGLKNIIIIESDDCILIADKDKISNIKILLEKIKKEKGEEYL